MTSTNQDYSKIITTVNSVTQNISIIPDQENVIVIDTSANRLGINTINPQHSIDVRDNSDMSGIIHGDHIKTSTVMSDLKPDIDICYNLGSQTNRWNRIDASYLEVTGINIRDATKFSIGESSENGVTFPLNVSVDGNLSANNLTVNDVIANDLTIDGININRDVNIKGNITIEGELISDYLDQKIEGSRASIILKSTATSITRDNLYSSYSGTTRLLEFSNQDVGIRNDLSGYTFRVTVSNSKYFINGVETPVLTLYTNTRYIFDQTDITNEGHPFDINNRTNRVVYNSIVTITTPETVGVTRYFCTEHGNSMGAIINLVSPYNNINIKFVDYASTIIDVESNINTALNRSEHNTFNFSDSIFQVLKSSDVIKMDVDFSGIVISEPYTGINLKFSTETQIVNGSMYDISLIIVLIKHNKNNDTLEHINNSNPISINSGSSVLNQYTPVPMSIGGISGDIISFGYLLYSDQYSDSSINQIRNSTFSTIDDYQSGGEYTPTTNTNGKWISTPLGDYNWYSIYYSTQYYNDSSTSFELSNNYPPFFDLSNNASNIKLQTHSDRYIDISNNKIKILDLIGVPILSINVSINNLYTTNNLGNIEQTYNGTYQDAHIKFKWTNIVYLINNGIIIDISMQHTNVITNTTTYTHPNYVINSAGEIVDRDSTVNYEWSNTVNFNLNNYNIYNNDIIEIKNLLVLQYTADAQPATHSTQYVNLTGNNVDGYYNNDGYSGETNYSGLNNSYHRRYQTSQNATYYMRHVYNGDISFNVNIDYNNIYNFSDIEINVQDVKLELIRETQQLFENIEVQNTIDASMIQSNRIDCSFITCTDTIDCSFIKALNVDFSGIPHIDNSNIVPSGYLYKDNDDFIRIKP